jgi:hypothetical protein
MAISPAGVALGLALARDSREGATLGLVGGLLGSESAGLLVLAALAGPARQRSSAVPGRTAAEAPAAKAPATKAPSATKRAAKTPAAKLPVAKTPAARGNGGASRVNPPAGGGSAPAAGRRRGKAHQGVSRDTP